MDELIKREASIVLPPVPKQMLPAIAALVESLGIPREVLAADEEIAYAWRDLPRELSGIPRELRGELIARMCVAISTGLFDGAINYAWNATILHLRQRIRGFGLPVVAQILQKDFEEKQLLELQDCQLLEMCLKLNLITEDGFFFLDQCRDTRNNFSAAHPTIGKINDREVMTFLNRCVRYALSDETSPRGVDIGSFISAIKSDRFTEGQCEAWRDRLAATHESQRQLLFGMVHGVYCDPASPEPVRLNAFDLCMICRDMFTSDLKSNLINRHSDYLAKGDKPRHTASLNFFENLGMLSILNESERHSVISKAARNLWVVHQGMNNFHNEPPFAERLKWLSEQGSVPETTQAEFVRIVIGCYIGNGYGVSWKAEPHYEAMIKSFSPREVHIMLALPKDSGAIERRISGSSSCRRRFASAVRLIDPATVPSADAPEFKRWV